MWKNIDIYNWETSRAACNTNENTRMASDGCLQVCTPVYGNGFASTFVAVIAFPRGIEVEPATSILPAPNCLGAWPFEQL